MHKNCQTIKILRRLAINVRKTERNQTEIVIKQLTLYKGAYVNKYKKGTNII